VSVRHAWVFVFLISSIFCYSQNSAHEKVFSAHEKVFSAPVSKVQAALKNLPGGTSGPLPVLDGFVVPSARRLEIYQRPYYQCSVRITSSGSAGSLVRVTAKITAWNSDTRHSGYEVLQSNGRLE
jgi:hypothetical protein